MLLWFGLWQSCQNSPACGFVVLCSRRTERMKGFFLFLFFNFLAGFHSSFPVSVFDQFGHNPALFLEMGLVL